VQQTIPTPQPAADEARHWRLKWGTRETLRVKDVIEVRAYGQLEVGISNPQQLAACLGMADEQALVEAAYSRLKDIVVQALQAALDKKDALVLSERSGSFAPEFVEQVTAAANASLRAQLAEMGLELHSFAIEGNSYDQPPEPMLVIKDAPPGAPGLGAGSSLEAMMAAMQAPDVPPSASPLLNFMTLAHVAAYLGVTETEVIELIESGRLKSDRIGSAYRVSKEQLEEYLQV
jgi:excisionase family DNA binding protein